jgi:SHO1 osmosensor
MAPGSIGGGNLDNRGSRAHSSAVGDPESHRRRSAGVWSTPSQTQGGASGGGGPGSMREVPPLPEATAGGGGGSEGLVPPPAPPSEGTRPPSGSHLDPNRPESTARTTAMTDATPVPQNLPRALALFDCELIAVRLSFRLWLIMNIYY